MLMSGGGNIGQITLQQVGVFSIDRFQDGPVQEKEFVPEVKKITKN